MLYFIGWSLFLILFKLLLRFRVVGRQNIPKTGAFIFASNHSSFLDPILLGTALHRGLYYMARDTLFNSPAGNWIMRRLHSFPVRRHEHNPAAVRTAIRLLAGGKPLTIFPEGTRSKDGTLKRAKPGIGFVAARSGVPVVPAYIKGSFCALPKGMWTLKFTPVTVYIGEPVTFDKGFTNVGKDAYQAISDAIMVRIAALKAKCENHPCCRTVYREREGFGERAVG